MSALNLITTIRRCHNDIRPSNIAFDGDSFCLIDFDMSRNYVVNQHDTAFSPLICSSGWKTQDRMLCFTVAQIAVTVFLLSADDRITVEMVKNSYSIWTTRRKRSAVDSAFQKWAEEKGPLVLGFIHEVRQAGDRAAWRTSVPTDYKQHCINVLKEMLA